MSFPTIPSITPSISLNRTQVVDLLLASIALEEMGLAHIINAEGEKLQTVLANLPRKCEPHYCESDSHRCDSSCEEILAVNREVRRTIQTVLKSQMLLQFKLEDILETQPPPPKPPKPPRPPHPPHPPCPPEPPKSQCMPSSSYPPPKSCFSQQDSFTDYYREPKKENPFTPGCQSCKMFKDCPKIRYQWYDDDLAEKAQMIKRRFKSRE